MIIDDDGNRNVFDPSNRVDHMADSFAHFIVDRFVLLQKLAVSVAGRRICLRRSRARRIAA